MKQIDKQKQIDIQRKTRTKQRKEISMTSPSLKTCDEDDDESTKTQIMNQNFILANYHQQRLTKSKTTTEFKVANWLH